MKPIERYAKYLGEAGYRDLTVKAYVGGAVAFTTWFEAEWGSPFAAKDLTGADLKEYRKHLVTEFAPGTVNRLLAAVKSWLDFSGRTDLTTGKPAAIFKTVPEQDLAPRWLARNEQLALLRAVQRRGLKREVALVNFLINTGLRVSELCALTWSDVAVSDRKGQATIRDSKGGKFRTIPLNADAREALLSMNPPYFPAAGDKTAVFMGQRGSLTPRGVQAMVAKIGVEAKIAALSPHVLRHTHAKNLIDAGVGIEQVAKLLGHSSLATTARYITPSHQDLEEAVERLGDLA